MEADGSNVHVIKFPSTGVYRRLTHKQWIRGSLEPTNLLRSWQDTGHLLGHSLTLALHHRLPEIRWKYHRTACFHCQLATAPTLGRIPLLQQHVHLHGIGTRMGPVRLPQKRPARHKTKRTPAPDLLPPTPVESRDTT
jgi:hypothetical protein